MGILDVDGSVLYSVLVDSGDDDHEQIVISSGVPENAEFVDVFWTPESAVFVGEEEGRVTWTLESLPANTVIGPFTYRVRFAEDATIPYRAAAVVTLDDGQQVENAADESALPVFNPTGSIMVDAAGTDGIVEVEDTGVFMLVPADAYDMPVTFSFERLPITEDTPLPAVADETWWCALFRVTVEPADAVASKPVIIFYPTRRTLTPDLPVFNFVQIPGSEWEAFEFDPAEARALAMKPTQAQAPSLPSGVVSPSGNQIIAILIGAVPAPRFNFAGGVPTTARVAAITDGTSNTHSLLTRSGITDGTSNIIDGTSNTIAQLPFIEQDSRLGR